MAIIPLCTLLSCSKIPWEIRNSLKQKTPSLNHETGIKTIFARAVEMVEFHESAVPQHNSEMFSTQVPEAGHMEGIVPVECLYLAFCQLVLGETRLPKKAHMKPFQVAALCFSTDKISTILPSMKRIEKEGIVQETSPLELKIGIVP